MACPLASRKGAEAAARATEPTARPASGSNQPPSVQHSRQLNLLANSDSKVIGGGPNLHMVVGTSPSKTKGAGRAPRQQLAISETGDGLATSLGEATARHGTQRGLSASTRGQGAQANSRPSKAAGPPTTAAFYQRGSHTARSGSRAGA